MSIKSCSRPEATGDVHADEVFKPNNPRGDATGIGQMTSASHEIEVRGSGDVVEKIQRAGIYVHGERRSIAQRVGFGRINVELVGIASARPSLEFAQCRGESFNNLFVESGHDITVGRGTDVAVGDDDPSPDCWVDHPVTIARLC
jgi:hypothetical protein